MAVYELGNVALVCELCGRPATDRHHCLYHRRKGKPELDHPYNLEMLCRECHMDGRVNGYEHRREFWRRQVKRHGQDFLDWHEGLPLKVKAKFD